MGDILTIDLFTKFMILFAKMYNTVSVITPAF